MSDASSDIKRLMAETYSARELSEIMFVDVETVRRWCKNAIREENSRLERSEVKKDPIGRYRISKDSVKRMLQNPSREY